MSSNIIAIDARLAGGQSTGDSTYWSGLLRGLAELEGPFEFLLFSNGNRPPGIPESPRFRWIQLKTAQSRWWSLVRFPLAARRLRAGAIHTQYNLSPLAGKFGISTIHDVSFFIGPQWFNPRDLFLLRKFVPASANRAAKVMTVSHTSKSEIEKFIPVSKGKVEVAYLGPNSGLEALSELEAQSIVATELCLSEPFLLSVSTRWPRKNMGLAVQAVDRLEGRYPHRLVLAGREGWGEERHSERVHLAGYVSNRHLSALYRAASLYLAPSLHEGFGLPLLEAFEASCPVLCSSGGALPEIAGEAAKVMKSWDPKDWTATIEELLADSSKLDVMREKGKRRAAEFSWRKCAEIHQRVYREVCS